MTRTKPTPQLRPSASQLKAIQGALTSAPRRNARAIWDHSYETLVRGDWPRGWEEYEARLEVPGLIQPQRNFRTPRWDGSPFPGRTLLLHYEQGLGDTLMFVRYASRVKALGGTVLLAAQAALADLVATCPGLDGVIPKGTPPPPFDIHFPLMSLPWLFRTTVDTIPAEVPYLDLPPRIPNRERLSERLERGREGLRIGLSWQGSASHPRDRERSFPASTFAPFASLPHASFFSFQREAEAELPFPGVEDLGPLLSDFSDSAFAVREMDLIVTVDTALAHLAGALGVPVFLLVTHRPDWRWMEGRTDSPWYPTMRIYRQPRPGVWTPVIESILADLLGA